MKTNAERAALPSIERKDNDLLFWTHGRREYMLAVRQTESPENPRAPGNPGQTGHMYCRIPGLHIGDYQMPANQFWEKIFRSFPEQRQDILLKRLVGYIPERTVQDDPDFSKQVLQDVRDGMLGYPAISQTLEDDAVILCIYMKSSWFPIKLIWSETPAHRDPMRWDAVLVGWMVVFKTDVMSRQVKGFDKVTEANWREAATADACEQIRRYAAYLQDQTYAVSFAVRDQDPRTKDEWVFDERSSVCYGSDITTNGAVDFMDGLGLGLSDAIRAGNYETGHIEEKRVVTYTYYKDQGDPCKTHEPEDEP